MCAQYYCYLLILVYLQSWTPTVRSLDLLSVRILDPCCLSECSDSRTSQQIVPTPLGHIYESLNMPPLSTSASVWYANSLLRPKIRRRDLTVTTSTIDSQRSLQTGDPRDVVAYCVTSHKGSPTPNIIGRPVHRYANRRAGVDQLVRCLPEIIDDRLRPAFNRRRHKYTRLDHCGGAARRGQSMPKTSRSV